MAPQPKLKYPMNSPLAHHNKVSKYSSLATNTGGRDLSWSQCDANSIVDAISAVCANGDAILFGTTSDGGALALTLCSGTERTKLYFTSVEQAEAGLGKIVDAARA